MVTQGSWRPLPGGVGGGHMGTDKDYYAILGVLPSIDDVALPAVYRALLKKYHPDVFGGSKAEAEIIEAL
jgi:curved DNA-binding protein CbpA